MPSTAKWRPSRSSAPTSTPRPSVCCNRGARLTELLKQPQFSPLKTEEQVAVIYAGVNGYLDNIPVDKVGEFEQGLLLNLRGEHASLLSDIGEKKALNDDLTAKLKAAVESFAKTFAA